MILHYFLLVIRINNKVVFKTSKSTKIGYLSCQQFSFIGSEYANVVLLGLAAAISSFLIIKGVIRSFQNKRYATETYYILLQRVKNIILSLLLTLFKLEIRGGMEGDKNNPYQFFSCNFYKRRKKPKNFLTFSFNSFATLV